MDYKLQLKTQKPIMFYDVCKIYQPCLNDILDLQTNEFEQLLLPYVVTIDSINFDKSKISDEEKETIKNFDIVISFEDIFKSLLHSLEYFCKSEISFDGQNIMFEGFEGVLNRDNFDEFAEIVLDINARERPKKEVIPIFKNDLQKDIWTKLRDGRRREALKKQLKLEDVLNYCEFAGNSYIPMDEILKWSLWRLMNCYKSIIGIDGYKDNFSMYLVSGEKSLIENKHWTDLIKIGYVPQE